MKYPMYPGFGDAFPGSAGPFVTPGTSPYQRSGSAASLAGFGTVVPESGWKSDDCPHTLPEACARWESERAAKKAKADLDLTRAQAELARKQRESSPIHMAGTALGWGASIAGVYHGYKRNNGSIGWALAWGLLGGLWPISIPLMLAQGFGKPIEPASK